MFRRWGRPETITYIYYSHFCISIDHVEMHLIGGCPHQEITSLELCILRGPREAKSHASFCLSYVIMSNISQNRITFGRTVISF